jgi:hypothetical protein
MYSLRPSLVALVDKKYRVGEGCRERIKKGRRSTGCTGKGAAGRRDGKGGCDREGTLGVSNNIRHGSVEKGKNDERDERDER